MKEGSIYTRAICAWGRDRQLLQATEECAELIKAISKYLNRGGPLENIIEEAVDVGIMLEQLKAMFPRLPWDIVHKQKMESLERLLKEMADEQRFDEGAETG